MTELLQDQLRVLSSNELMIAAINGIISERIEKEKPIIESTDSDVELGQKYRAYERAKKILKEALVDISSYNEKKSEPNKINKGR